MRHHRSVFLLACAVPKLKPVKTVTYLYVLILEVDAYGRVHKFLEIIIHDSFDEGTLADVSAAEQTDLDVFFNVVIFILDNLLVQSIIHDDFAFLSTSWTHHNGLFTKAEAAE